ncbi:MAG: glutamate racemase [Candidatus Omnitrophica bacterium]|nr:glutamate racemase [Candidatus Omnitrophota bacterium]
MNKPIGVFDSGVGGLTVVKELMRLLPRESIVYFGDTARVPYGTKSAETIRKFSLENILFLLKKNVKLVVVACNTASSIALPQIKRHFKVPIIGVILPGVKEAVAITKNKRIGVIATRATVNSQSYTKEIKALNPKIKVFSAACPLFVPLAEEGWLNDKVTFDVARKYLEPFRKYKIDTLILGCTHYPLLKSAINKVLGKGVTLIDSAKQVACEVKQILDEDCSCSQEKKPSREFYVSDEPDNFRGLAQRFLGYKLNKVYKVNCV